MSRLNYIIGSALEPVGDRPQIITHCLSTTGAHDAGFALALSRKWPESATVYRRLIKSGEASLGDCITYMVEPGLWTCSIIGQFGLGSLSLRLAALMAGMCDVADIALRLNASVHMPRIGCGLAGGKWTEVGPQIEGIFNAPLVSFIPVTVYDLPAKK